MTQMTLTAKHTRLALTSSQRNKKQKVLNIINTSAIGLIDKLVV